MNANGVLSFASFCLPEKANSSFILGGNPAAGYTFRDGCIVAGHATSFGSALDSTAVSGPSTAGLLTTASQFGLRPLTQAGLTFGAPQHAFGFSTHHGNLILGSAISSPSLISAAGITRGIATTVADVGFNPFAGSNHFGIQPSAENLVLSTSIFAKNPAAGYTFRDGCIVAGHATSFGSALDSTAVSGPSTAGLLTTASQFGLRPLTQAGLTFGAPQHAFGFSTHHGNLILGSAISSPSLISAAGITRGIATTVADVGFNPFAGSNHFGMRSLTEVAADDRRSLTYAPFTQIEFIRFEKVLRHACSQFVRILRGGLTTLNGPSDDRIRQAAHSGRELLNQFLARRAPNSVFTKDEIAQHGVEGRVTRSMRVSWILGGHAEVSSPSDFCRKFCHEVKTVHDGFTEISHRRDEIDPDDEEEIQDYYQRLKVIVERLS